MSFLFRFLSLVAFGFAPFCFWSLTAAAAAAPAAGGTSVWKVAGERGGATLYLAGSIHLLAEADHPLPGAFGRAYRASDRLVLEVKSAGGPGGDVAVFEKGMYGDGGGSIKDDLSPAAYAKLRVYLADAGLPAAAMDAFHPWLAAMTISLTEIMKMGYRPDLGVDSFFENKALEDGKPVGALETTAFQIGLFAKLGRKLQEQMLLSTLADMADLETEFPRLVKAWRAGDDAALGRLMYDSMADMPEFRAEILDKRNRRWIEKLVRMLGGDEDVMVVVGAGHLVGKQGVVQLLRKRGYEVERLLAPPRKRPGSAPAKPAPAKPAPGRFIPVGV